MEAENVTDLRTLGWVAAICSMDHVGNTRKMRTRTVASGIGHRTGLFGDSGQQDWRRDFAQQSQRQENRLFSDSPDGTDESYAIYSLIETARQSIDRYAHLHYALSRVPEIADDTE